MPFQPGQCLPCLGGEGSAVTYGSASTTEGKLSVPDRLYSSVTERIEAGTADWGDTWKSAPTFAEDGTAEVTVQVPALKEGEAALPRFVQYASVTGVWGVSTWVVGINVLVLLVLRPRLPRRRRLALAAALAALIVVPLGHGAAVLASPLPAGDRVRVDGGAGTVEVGNW